MLSQEERMPKKSPKALKPQHSPDVTHIVADFFLKVEQLAHECRAAVEAASSTAPPSPPPKARKPHSLHKFYDAFHRAFKPAREAGTYRFADNYSGLPVKRDGTPISRGEIARMARSKDRSIGKSTAEKYARLFVIVKTLNFSRCPGPPDSSASTAVKRQWVGAICDSLENKSDGKFLRDNCPDELVEDLANTGGLFLWASFI
jgi:hypothetical protein